MKKILIIPFILLIGCNSPEILFTEVVVKNDIFSVKGSTVLNGQSIHFDLPSTGTYTLTLINNSTNQVISRERFVGQKGENVKKIYTNSLPKGYLILVLEDINKNQLDKTTIINN
jgi:hypothetical protein